MFQWCYSLFKNLANEWRDLGTTVGVLSANSDNVVKLIKDSYEVCQQLFVYTCSWLNS